MYVILLIFQITILSSAESKCPVFDERRWETSIWCSSKCIQEENNLYGTMIYTKNSSICRAALHAGVVDPKSKGSNVLFQEVKPQKHFHGTIRNRVVSTSISFQRYTEAFEFTSKIWKPFYLDEDSWLTDVHLIHNSYREGDRYFRLSCLWDDPNGREDQRLLRWNYKPVSQYTTFTTGDIKRTSLVVHKTQNLKAFNCLGRNSISDVLGISSKSNGDSYVTDKLTYRGYPSSNLTINFTKTLHGDKIFLRKLPNQWPYISGRSYPDVRVPLFLSNLNENYNGLYIAGSEGKNKRFFDHDVSANAAHFEVMVQDCAQGHYGASCQKKCQFCQNDGICHPLIGACICKPGFHGKLCDKRCPLDHFGSRCQFNCTDHFLGRGMTLRDAANCKGLVFCLPKPFGCSCSFGYDGFTCNNVIELEFPYFKSAPKVTVGEDFRFNISFDPWNSETEGGDTYGLSIIYYELVIADLNQKKVFQWKRFKVDEKLEYISKRGFVNTIYAVWVRIHLKGIERTGRKNNFMNSSAEKKFSLPCYENPSIAVEQGINSLNISVNVPEIQMEFKGCWFAANMKGTYEREDMKKICFNSSISDKLSCMVSELPSGQSFTIEIWCQNAIGECKPTTANTFTLPNIRDYIRFEINVIEIFSFHVLNLRHSDVKILAISEGANDTIPSEIEKNQIQKYDFKILASLRDMVYNNISGSYIYSLNNIDELKGNRIVVVLYYLYNGTADNISAASYKIPDEVPLEYIIPLASLALLLGLLVGIALLRRERDKKKNISKIFGVNLGPSSMNVSKASRAELPYENIPTSSAAEGINVKKPIESVFHGSAYENLIDGDIYEEENDYSKNLKVEELEIYLNGLIHSPESQQAFLAIPKNCGKSTSYGEHPRNKLKNRYKNNLPYDDTRVTLSKKEEDDFSDYINANILKSPNGRKWYIPSQGPKQNNVSTVNDFWRMVVEQNVTVIVMVANFKEKGKIKVGLYFDPNGGVVETEDFKIQLIDRIQNPHYIRSIIQISDTSRNYQTLHFQFVTWPDHGVPSQTLPLVLMVKDVINNFTEGGIVVHCSAGIGRTGTILMILLMKEMLDYSSWIDPILALKTLRETRPGLVENFPQYNLSLVIFYEYIFSDIGAENFEDFQRHYYKDIKRIRALYERLSRQEINHSYKTGYANMAYNRSENILPCDSFIATIQDNLNSDSDNNYINAISVDTTGIPGSLIVTEHPTQSTMLNFWRLIMSRKCSYVVLLNVTENTEEYPSIFPIGMESIVYPGLSIAINESYFDSNGQHYDVQLHSQETCHSARVIQIAEWPRGIECPSNITLLHSIAVFISENASSQSPFLVCCSDGVTACGLLCASIAVINRLSVYQDLNIYSSALRIKRFRPEFITSMNQLNAIYQVAKIYLDENATYQNFEGTFDQ